MRHALAALILSAAAAPARAQDLGEAQRLLREGKAPEAVRMLEELRAERPADADVHRLLGVAYFDAGRLADARAELVAALELGRITADVLSRLVFLDREAEDLTAAAAAGQMLALLDPEDVAWRVAYGDLLAQGGSEEAARGVYTGVLREHPGNHECWLRLGDSFARSGEMEQAAPAFAKAYYLGAEEPAALARLVEVHRAAGDLAGALAWCERVRGLPDADPELALQQAELQIALGDRGRARAVLEAYREAHPGDARCRLLLGRIAFEEGRAAEAAAELAEAVRLGEDSRELHEFLGRHFLQQGDAAQAAVHLRAAVPAEPPEREVLALLVRAETRSGQPDAARASLTRYLEHHGLDATARALLEELLDAP